MVLKVDNISEILEKISLNNIFLFVGAFATIFSVISRYDLGIRIGVITLIFGGILRVQLHLNKALPAHPRYHSKKRVFFVNIGRFLLWLLTLFLYSYSINKVLPLF